MVNVFVPIIFNFLVVIFVSVIWGKFIRDLIQSARGKSNENPNSSKRQNHKTQSKQTKTSGNKRSQVNTIQSLLKNDPTELHRILRERLPDHYHKELETIFNSPQPMIAIIKFVRRKDIWPVLQTLQTPARSSNLDRRVDRLKKEAKQTSTEEYELNPSYEPVEMEQHINDFINEYDSYGTYFDQLLGDVSADLQDTSEKVEQIKESSDKEWLRNAVIANTILERPEH